MSWLQLPICTVIPYVGLRQVEMVSEVLRKNTPYASQVSAEKTAKEAYDMGLRKVDVVVKGPGSGREAAIRALTQAGLGNSFSIIDKTPIPHNGCQSPEAQKSIVCSYSINLYTYNKYRFFV